MKYFLELLLNWGRIRPKFFFYLGWGFLVFTLVGLLWFFVPREAPLEVELGEIVKADLVQEVVLVGTVNYQAVVSVGAQVSGTVKALHVDYNANVEPGQLMAVIDPDALAQRLKQAQAEVKASRAALQTQQLLLEKARSDLLELQSDFERMGRLYTLGAVSGTELDRSKSSLRAGSIGLQSSQASLDVAEASIAQREAVVQQMRVELARSEVRSPVQGRVVRRLVENGQTLSAHTQSPELFLIATQTDKMQIQATVDEVDVSKVRVGMRARFTTEAFRGQEFDATVLQIRHTPTQMGASVPGGVAQYQVLLSFEDPEQRFLQGMTALVKIETMRKPAVLQVPNAALHVVVPATMQEKLKITLPKTDQGSLRVVYRQVSPGQWQAIPVQTGLTTSDMTEVSLPTNAILPQALHEDVRQWFQAQAPGLVIRWQGMQPTATR